MAQWDTAERVKGLLARFIETHRASWRGGRPMLSLAAGRDGRVLLSIGIGEASDGTRPSGETLYRIGSISKQMTAAAVLRAIEGGATTGGAGRVLSFDTDVADVFDAARNWRSLKGGPITVRRLLTMTSNLPNYTRRPPSGADPWGGIAAPRLLDELAKLAPRGWPGDFEYSNTNYFLLASLLDRVGAPSAGHAAAMAALFDRAGMTNTFVTDGDHPARGLALPHYTRRPAFAEPDWLKGSADVVSSANDLFRWNSALFSGRVVGRPMLEQMLAEGARVSPTTYYGMGWFMAEQGESTVFSHTGSVPGYSSVNMVVTKRNPASWIAASWLAVSILVNVDSLDDIDELAAEVAELLAAGSSPD